MSDELLPCPFCGESNAIICETDYEGNTEIVPAYAVSCRTKQCAAGIWSLAMGHFDTEQKAIEAWNTRPDSKPSPIDEILGKISRVAHGEDQVGDDDTDGMAWIAEFVDNHRGLLADSKPYKWASFHEWWVCLPYMMQKLMQGADIAKVIFNAARERKE